MLAQFGSVRYGTVRKRILFTWHNLTRKTPQFFRNIYIFIIKLRYTDQEFPKMDAMFTFLLLSILENLSLQEEWYAKKAS